MSAANTNRETVRDLLYSLLNTALTGTATVYGYPKGDFNQRSPVVCIKSAGSQRTQRTLGSDRRRSRLYFNVFVFVLYSDPGTSYGEDAAADSLDLIEKTIADTLADNPTYTADSGATYAWAWAESQQSEIDDVPVGMAGDEYMRERIPVEVLVFND